MVDFTSRLLGRTLGVAPVVQPLVGSRYDRGMDLMGVFGNAIAEDSGLVESAIEVTGRGASPPPAPSLLFDESNGVQHKPASAVPDPAQAGTDLVARVPRARQVPLLSEPASSSRRNSASPALPEATTTDPGVGGVTTESSDITRRAPPPRVRAIGEVPAESETEHLAAPTRPASSAPGAQLESVHPQPPAETVKPLLTGPVIEVTESAISPRGAETRIGHSFAVAEPLPRDGLRAQPTSADVEHRADTRLVPLPDQSPVPPFPEQSARPTLVRSQEAGTRSGPDPSRPTTRQEWAVRSEEAPTVRITIGRIDVRAVTPAAPSEPRSAKPTRAETGRVSLQDYLHAPYGPGSKA